MSESDSFLEDPRRVWLAMMTVVLYLFVFLYSYPEWGLGHVIRAADYRAADAKRPSAKCERASDGRIRPWRRRTSCRKQLSPRPRRPLRRTFRTASYFAACRGPPWSGAAASTRRPGCEPK